MYWGHCFRLLCRSLSCPIFLEQIGLERYGVLSIALVILGYFGLFDLGLGRTTAQKIATLKDADGGARSVVIWAALLVNVAFGAIGALVIAPLAMLYFSNFMSLESGLES